MGWRENRRLTDLDVDCIMMSRTRRTVRNGFVSVNGRYYQGPTLTTTDGHVDDTGVWKYDGTTLDVRYSPWDPSYIIVRVPDSTEPWRPLLLDDTAAVMLDEATLRENMARKREQMRAVRRAFKVATAMVGDVIYRPDGPHVVVEEQHPVPRALPEPKKAIPMRPAYFAHGWERYEWCLHMVLNGNMEHMSDEDREFVRTYRNETEYLENVQRWTFLEKEIKARGIRA